MIQTIDEVFTGLDQSSEPLSLRAILDWFKEVPLTLEDVANYLAFRPDRYVRNRLHDGPAYQALVRNAIKWVASPEALAWAKANPTHIFK